MLFFGQGALQAMLGGRASPVASRSVPALIVAGGIVRLLGRRMAAKTAEGSAVLAQSLGFKEYLMTAEAGQIEFEEASNVFSRYLPYAVVFGVADRWASTFAQVAQAAEAAGQSAHDADLVPLERLRDARLHEHRQRGRLLLDHLDGHLHLDARARAAPRASPAVAASAAAAAAAPRPAPGSALPETRNAPVPVTLSGLRVRG